MSARVLVVDDVLPNVKLLEAKLAREYYEVLTAFSGFEAIERARQTAPDIILLDVMMPEMDGFETCRRLKADAETRHIPVVMVTALSDAANRVEGLEAGADDFLTKPVADMALFARVRSLTRLKMMMDEWRTRQSTSGELGVLGEVTELEQRITDAKVLVVEDNPLDLDKIMQAIRGDCAVLETAQRANLAAAFTEKYNLDLVIVSINLIADDGLRLSSHLRSSERSRHTPILLVGEADDLDRVAKGLELGANDYLSRPIDPNELRARVRTQIRRKRYQDRMRANYEQSLSMALTDPLTGVFNRRYLDSHLARTLSRSEDLRKPVSVLMFDVDHFKMVNDQFGHASGDVVLKELARRVSDNLRSFDMVARYGGEEFLVVMPETPIEVARTVAERLRVTVSSEPYQFDGSENSAITISIGIATSPDGSLPQAALVDRADKALYRAKELGRNTTVVWDESLS